MDEFIRKKVLYFLKSKYDESPYQVVNLLEHFENEVTVIERTILYLAKKKIS